MASIGWGLIKCVIENDIPLTELYEQGIDENYFINAEKKAFEFVKDFKDQHNRYPNPHTVAVEAGDALAFDGLENEPLGYWVPQVKERKQHQILADALQNVSNHVDKGNIAQALKSYREHYDKLLDADDVKSVRDLQQVQLEVIEDHNKRQVDPDLPGISYGLPSLDEVTGGNQDGDFNLIVGETGTCKSYFSSFTALSAYNSGARIIMISPELPEKQLARRILAMQCQFSDRALKRGLLSYYGIEKARNNVTFNLNQEGQDNYFKIMPSGLSSDINRIISIANEYSPDFIVVDGIYLISNPRYRVRWEMDESIYFILKNFSLQKNLPVLATTQYNRSDAKNLRGARGTQSAEQVSSTFISLEYESEEDRETNSPQQYRLGKVKKSRDGDRITLRIGIDFNRTHFWEEQVLSGPQYLENIEQEEDINDHPHITEL